jgi:hypothetical protein
MNNEVRQACFEREGYLCAACRAAPATELDHALGRRNAESVETCWALCTPCHRDKTDSKPSKVAWVWIWLRHVALHGYHAQVEAAKASLQWHETKHGFKKASPE